MTTTTRRIERDEWGAYCRRASALVAALGAHRATIERLTEREGDQLEADDAPFLGMYWDDVGDALVLRSDDRDHLALHPVELWAVEEDGFPTSLELVLQDGTTEIVRVVRGSRQPELPATP